MRFTRVVFPLPLTPVTTVSMFNGKATSMSFRLCSAAPRTTMRSFTGLRRAGTAMDARPVRYCAVRPSFSCNSAWVPVKTTRPPCDPAIGPMSMMWSAARITSSSCSTTITVLPRSRSFFSTPMSRSVSRECRPMLGSSRMYMLPTRLLPREVARSMRWVSPPLRVLLRRSRVR